MDRNSIFGILIIAGILIVWGIIQTPGKKELEARRKYEDSLYQAQQLALQKSDSVRLLITPDSGTQASTVDSASVTRVADQYGVYASNATGTNEFYTIENEVMKMTLSTRGGRPYSVQLKKYKNFARDPVVLFNGDSTQFGISFFEQNRPILTNDLFFKASEVTDTSIIMKMAVNENRYIQYYYSLKPDDYMVNFSIQLAGMKEVGSLHDHNSLDFNWELYIPQQEQEKKYENQYTSLYFRHHQEDVDFFKPRQNKEAVTENIPTQIQWVAFKNQFFSSIIIADNGFSNAFLKSTNLPETDSHLKNFRAEVGIPFQRLDTETINLKLFFGPNKFKLLKGYGNYELEDLVSVGRGIIRWINQYLIIPVFDWLSKFIGNFGIIILLLTIIIKVLLLPLTYKSYLSQARMKVLKPQIDDLTQKFPKGKELERQQATMSLYKKAGISPLGGCLPMLLQFPILFAMFRFFPTSIELRQEGFLWATDLSTYDSIFSWSAQIPILSNLYGNHISLFTILMTVSTIIQMKFSDTTSTQQMPGMKTMMYIMPVMFMFMLNRFSAGLTYYYFLTNVITIGQNFLFKQFVDEKEILRKIEERKAKPVKKSKWQQRLEDMQKNQHRKPVKSVKTQDQPKKSPSRQGQNPSRKSSKGN